MEKEQVLETKDLYLNEDVFISLSKFSLKLDPENNNPEFKKQFRDVIQTYADYYECLQEDKSLPPLFLVDPQPLDDETLCGLSVRHIEYYKPVVDEIVQDYKKWKLLILNSGMYGGKTTLAVLTIRKIEEEMNINTSVLIAEEMNEECINARALEDGKIAAKKYGIKNFPDQKSVNEFVKTLEEVVLLDEYSFADQESVLMLMKACADYNKKLILLGLDTNAFGEELGIFKNDEYISRVNKSSCHKVLCRSFVKSEQEKPTGRSQVRYFKDPYSDLWILDLGFLRLVISKELKDLIFYVASNIGVKDVLCSKEDGDIVGFPPFEASLNRIANDLGMPEEKRTSLHEAAYRLICDRIYDNER